MIEIHGIMVCEMPGRKATAELVVKDGDGGILFVVTTGSLLPAPIPLTVKEARFLGAKLTEAANRVEAATAIFDKSRAVELIAKEHLKEPKPVSKRKLPPPPSESTDVLVTANQSAKKAADNRRQGTPWTDAEKAAFGPYLSRGKCTTAVCAEIRAQLPPRDPPRNDSMIQGCFERLLRKHSKKSIWIGDEAPQDSAPPSTNVQTEDGQGPSEPEIVDEKAAGVPPGQVTEHHVDGAEATNESDETRKRDELKALYAASRTTPPPALPSPQSRIDREMSRAVRNSKGGGLSVPDMQPDYEAPLSTDDPLLERLNDDKSMGSR